MGIKFKAAVKKLKSLIVGSSGNVADVNSSGELKVALDEPIEVKNISNLISEPYDEIQIIRDTCGKITSVIYLLGVTTVSTLTLTYDVSDNLIKVEKT